jgi:hypothetical protein
MNGCNRENELFICACHSPEHQFILSYDEEDNEIYLNIYLKHNKILKRIIVAIKHIFGYKSN